MKSVLLAGAAFAALSTAAVAADMPVAAPEAAVVESGDWSGLYVGIQGGYAFGDVEFDLDDSTGADIFSGDSDADGFTIGAYAGSNYQFGNWVLGVDSSVSFVDIDETVGEFSDDFIGDADDDLLSVDVKLDFLSTTRGRVGYAFDNVMLFAAGGFAVAHTETSVSIASDSGSFDDDEDQYHVGWTLGAGLETKFADSWSARLEYLYVDLGDEDFAVTDGGETFLGNVDLDMHVVRAGVAYHF